MTESSVERCPVCGDLPDRLVVRTGQGEEPPVAVAALEVLAPLDLQQAHRSGDWCTARELLRCPRCLCLFDRQDEPQYMGSGNLDEQRYSRFPLDQSRVAGGFLDGTLADPDQIFAALSKDLLWLVLDASAGESIQHGSRSGVLRAVVPAIRQVVPGIVECMIARDKRLLGVLGKLVDHAPDSAVDVAAAFERSEPIPDYAHELREICARTTKRRRGKSKR